MSKLPHAILKIKTIKKEMESCNEIMTRIYRNMAKIPKST